MEHQLPKCTFTEHHWLLLGSTAEDRRTDHLPEGIKAYSLPDWCPHQGCPLCKGTSPPWLGHPGRQCPSRSHQTHSSAGVVNVLSCGQSWGVGVIQGGWVMYKVGSLSICLSHCWSFCACWSLSQGMVVINNFKLCMHCQYDNC